MLSGDTTGEALRNAPKATMLAIRLFPSSSATAVAGMPMAVISDRSGARSTNVVL